MRQRTHALRARHVLVGALLVLATAGAVSAEEALGRNPLPVGALPRRPPGPVLARARADPPAPPPGGAPRLPPPRVRTLSPGRTVPGYPSPEPVPAGGTRAAGAGPGGTGPADGPLRPTPPPPRPATSPTPSPQDFVFGVDEVGGTILPLPDGKDRMVWVMMGNPRIQGFAHTRADGQRVDDLWIKANSVVVWLDLAKLGSLDALAGGGPAEGNGGEEKAARIEPDGRPPERTRASVIQEAVLGLYAEGAVELIYGNLSFRSERLYLEPPTYKALLLEPRFTGHLPQDVNGAKAKPGRPTPSDLPLHVRARRARLVARGVAVFDEAEMSLSRADDKMALEVTRLIVEEEQPEPGGGEEGEFGSIPTLMGFRSITNQHYTTEGTYLRGERLPLFYWGSANFSYPFSKNFPVRLRGFTFGNRSSTGRYAIATLGGTVTREDEALFDWDVLLGGYLARGPALGGRIRWDRPRTKGKAFAWSVYEFGREEDASGFMPPHPWRWLAEVETRNDLTKKLQFDFEFNDFSDAGVNLEYFENDALTHKDRESYGRLRWSEDLGVATLTGKWHERDDVTETTQLPQAALWSSGVPLVVPRRKGGLAVDLVTRSRFGYLQRRHADIVPYTDPGALRLDTLTTFGAGLDVGDVRLSAWAGPDVDGYMFRDPDATALWRTALAAGARANLQLHRTFAASGGPFQLDRLRHVIDLDAGFDGRYADDTPLTSVPAYDESDHVRDHTATSLRVRNRLQTRAQGGGIRTLLDLDVVGRYYLDERGPYLIDTPAQVTAYLRAQPRRNLYLAGEGEWNVGGGGFEKGFFGAGTRFSEDLVAVSGVRYIRGEAVAPVVDVSWRWSEKYGIRVRELYNVTRDENFARIVLGRYSQDHALFAGVSQRADHVDFQFNFQTTVGGGGLEAERTFNDEPSPQPFGVFPP